MKNSVKNINKRQNDILLLLQKHEQLTTQQLADKTNTSLSTIRRDLIILEEKNEIIRNHGYCLYNYKNKENFDETGPLLIKNEIARAAAAFINHYDTVFVNTSSTALKTLDYTVSDNITVVSNNLKMSNSKHRKNSNYILTGGEMRFPKEALVGDIAVDTISSIHADTCIIGCSGVDLENGVTTKVFNEAKINELMINRTTRNRVLVADHRKIGRTSKFKIADLSSFNYLVTDTHSSQNILKKFEKTGIEIIQIEIN